MTTEDLSAARRRLADALKQLRLDVQLSAQELGNEFGWSQSKVSKIENGRTVPSLVDVERWLQRFGADDAIRKDLVELAAEVATQATAWREVNRRGFSARQKARGERDAEASGIAIYQSEVIPGLLQTSEYARRVLEVHSQVPSAAIPAAVLSRLDRQTVLFDETKRIEAVITETALRWRPGTATLTLAQLDRISSLATLPNVHIGVIPWEAQTSAKPLHSFVILRYPDDAAEVQVETLTAEVTVTEPDDVRLYEEFFAHQRQHAVFDTELTQLIARLSGELSEAGAPSV